MRLIFPLILILLSIGLFLGYTNKTYSAISGLRTQSAAYNEALFNSRKLLEVRDELTKKYNDLSVEDRDRLLKLMPDNVDNIRLIIDIQKIAAKYGMQPRDIRFDSPVTSSQTQASPQQLQEAQKDYGTFTLDFSVAGSYANFLSFLKDLEKSLRIVDVSSITFASGDTANTYKYNFKIKTYWLKN